MKKGKGRPKAKGLTKTKTIGGKRFTKSSCSKTKTAATATVSRLRKRGFTARVVKNPAGGYCAYKGAKAKSHHK